MYNEQIEGLISAALADGVLTEKEKQILFKKAQSQGIDLDEFEMVLDARLVELQKAEKEKAEKSAPKSTKYGDVRKCPVCGALVPALAVVCPECGYEFSGVDANLSSQKLSAQLIEAENEFSIKREQEIEKFKPKWFSTRTEEIEENRKLVTKKYEIELKNRKKTIIESFAIPTTKSDLFEFISSLQSKSKDDELYNSYNSKLEECIVKAKALFPDDIQIARLIEQHNAKAKLRKKQAMIKGIVSFICCAVALCLCAIYINNKIYNQKLLTDSTLCREAIDDAVRKGDIVKAEKLFYNFEDKSDLGDEKVVDALVKYYLSNDMLAEAEEVAAAEDVKINYYTGNATATAIITYLINHDMFEEANKYYGVYYKGNYLYDVISYMCHNGRQNEARIFLQRHISEITKQNHIRDKWADKAEIKKFLTDYINDSK